VQISFAIVVAVLVWLSISSQSNLLLQQEKSVLETQQQVLMGQIKSSEKMALALATITANRPDVQEAFADRDRNLLMDLTLPGFQALSILLGQSIQGQFHIPRATSFLRLNDLDKHSDDLSAFRPAVVNVNFAKKRASGIEVGRYSAAVRGIVPIFADGQHMGSIEFGAGLSSELLSTISKEFNINSAIYFDAKSSELGAYFEAQKEKARGAFVLFAASTKKIRKGAPDEIRKRVIKSGKTEVYYDHPGKKAITVSRLVDYNNKAIGTIEIHLDRTEVLAQIAHSRNMSVLAGVVLALLGGIFITWLVNHTVNKPVREITNVYASIGMGDFDARAKVNTTDEMGTMASSLNAMLDNTLNLIQSQDERDRIQDSIMKLLDEISSLTEGDLTARAEVTEEITGSIADSFNAMAEQLTQVVQSVKGATHQVGATSSEISSTTEKLAETTEKQAVQISEAIEEINSMAAAMRQVAEYAVNSTKVSEQSTLHAKQGAQAVEHTNQAMASIRERVQETARSIKRLGESSQEIGNIVQIINDIADRTSILALNASIQAAMAGDAGRGFAVVAEEVQRLAERSASSTKQIDTLVKNIQGEINEAGTSMDESIQRVSEGTKLAGDAHEKLQEIQKVSTDLAKMIQSITSAADKQAKVSETIATTMESVGEVSTKTSSESIQTAVSMRNLAETADKLRQSVEVFKIAEDVNMEDKAA
jgi:methyl-accepting chemotaxis protein